MNVKERAAVVFAEAQKLIDEDCRGMLAEHSANGLLGSGNTLRRAVEIFAQRSNEALIQIQSEVANVIDHRGRAWNRAMSEVSTELETMITKAPVFLESSVRIAAPKNERGKAALYKLIDESADKLRNDFAAFRSGYTASKSKRWNERYPVSYAILLLVVGAIIGKIVDAFLSRLGNI